MGLKSAMLIESSLPQLAKTIFLFSPRDKYLLILSPKLAYKTNCGTFIENDQHFLKVSSANISCSFVHVSFVPFNTVLSTLRALCFLTNSGLYLSKTFNI